jgi:hypothetical protein
VRPTRNHANPEYWDKESNPKARAKNRIARPQSRPLRKIQKRIQFPSCNTPRPTTGEESRDQTKSREEEVPKEEEDIPIADDPEATDCLSREGDWQRETRWAEIQTPTDPTKTTISK